MNSEAIIDHLLDIKGEIADMSSKVSCLPDLEKRVGEIEKRRARDAAILAGAGMAVTACFGALSFVLTRVPVAVWVSFLAR